MKRCAGSPRLALAACACAFTAWLAGCADSAKQAEEEAVKNSIACQMSGERVVIRFDTGEARMLIGGTDRVTLYQIPSASGVRYTNGTMELRGKGNELELLRFGTSLNLSDCKPYAAPK